MQNLRTANWISLCPELRVNHSPFLRFWAVRRSQRRKRAGGCLSAGRGTVHLCPGCIRRLAPCL